MRRAESSRDSLGWGNTGKNKKTKDDDDGISGNMIGTRFPDEDSAKQKSGPAWKQEATDDQGRRRFHGAFTGGFSSGYFNTCGTAEGWEPSSFVSSRSKRADSLSSQKYEDYMDEEDKKELADRTLSARSEFDMSKTFAPKERKINSVPEDLICTSSGSMGIKLLRKMGWREGHGIGERKHRKAKQISGPLMTISDDTKFCEIVKEEEVDLSFYPADFKFAPISVEAFKFCPKENTFGIGYDPFFKAPEFRDALGSRKDTAFLAKEKRINLGKAAHAGGPWGHGIFESDDMEVYDDGGLTGYDFELMPEKSNKLRSNSSGNVDRISFVFNLANLKGFCPATKMGDKPKWYPPPTIPRDYVPIHRFDIEKSESYSNSFRHSQIDSSDRARLLGENRLPSSDSSESKHLNLVSDRVSKDISKLPRDNRTGFGNGMLGDVINQRFTSSAILFSSLEVPAAPFTVKEEVHKESFLGRTTEQWIPTPLLSKRFNVPALPQAINLEAKDWRNEVGFVKDAFLPTFSEDSKNLSEHPETKGFALPSEKDLEDPFDESLNEIKRPPIDFFKAIFEESDDEVENSGDEHVAAEATNEPIKLQEEIVKPCEVFSGDSEKLFFMPDLSSFPNNLPGHVVCGPPPPPPCDDDLSTDITEKSQSFVFSDAYYKKKDHHRKRKEEKHKKKHSTKERKHMLRKSEKMSRKHKSNDHHAAKKKRRF